MPGRYGHTEALFRKSPGGTRWLYIFNIVCSLLPCGIFFVWGGIGSVSLFTALLGCLFGIVTVAQTVFNLKALETGPMSYTNVICSFSTIISALSGVMASAVFFPIVNGGGMVLNTLAAVVLFRDKPTKLQWLGIILGIASVLFLCDPFH